MPSPNKGESKDAFVSRCMSDNEMNEKFPDRKQRYSVCNSYFSKADIDKSLESDKTTMGCGCNNCGSTSEATADEEEGYPPKCNEGYEVNEEGTACVPVAVTIELEIDDFKVVANEKNYHIEISGVAFHEGLNKNNWALTREGASSVVEQMIGADITLNHPDASEYGSGFDRNMDGGVDKSIVGYITSAKLLDTVNGGWEVRYVGTVVRSELYENLESGLWTRKDYGVSIGGSGIPIEAGEDGIIFGEDFTFDHIAIVHRPAYERASIENVQKVLIAEETNSTFIGHSISARDNKPEVKTVSDENVMEAVAATEAANAEEIESLKADLILSRARVKEFEDAENARAESERMALVDEATELGMSGHDDLSSDTLTNLIASWQEAHPEPTPVEMAPVAEPSTVVEASESTSAPRAVVANFLNGRMVESDEEIYERCWNAWAKAWNGTLHADEKSTMRAPMWGDAKELIN